PTQRGRLTMRVLRSIPYRPVGSALLLIGVGVACSSDSATQLPGDAGSVVDAASLPDSGAARDSQTPLGWVEFSIIGCAAGESGEGMGDAGSSPAGDAAVGEGDGGMPDEPPCTGEAPLQLRFAAIAPAAVELYAWEFIVEDKPILSDLPSPVVTFTEPGEVSVRLIVGGPGGTAEVVKPGIIRVVRSGLGADCAADSDCADGRECVCPAGESCPAGLDSGLCSVECGPSAPCLLGVCAALDAGAAEPADWRRSLCLPACDSDSECPADLRCQEFRDGAGAGWVRGCFAPGVVAAMGQSCFDAAGQPDNSRCASGVCAAVGARGACSALCENADCPPSSTCATFIDPGPELDEPLCLLRCFSPELCLDDPWLACELPDGTGRLDFTVDDKMPISDSYCAPRTCVDAGDCGVDGRCLEGFCGL
ncbi:MAG: hypothetical protein AAGC55_18790, partial [Myxococcota bacterium]